MNLCPDWLNQTAQNKYMELSSKIPQTPQAHATLAMFVDVFSNYVSCVIDINTNGLVTNMKPNPAIKLKVELIKTIMGLLKQLKLSTSSIKEILTEELDGN